MDVRTIDSSPLRMMRTKELAALIACPICDKLQKQATTTSECLHSFCNKCIYKKITEEKIRSCPVCGTDLGCNPLQKLRPDNAKRDLKEHLFGAYRRTPEERAARRHSKQAAKEQLQQQSNSAPAVRASLHVAQTKKAESPKQPAVGNKDKGKITTPLEETAGEVRRYMTRTQSRSRSRSNSVVIRSPPASPPRAIINDKERFFKGKGKMPLEAKPVKEKKPKGEPVFSPPQRKTCTPQAVVDTWRKPSRGDSKIDQVWVQFEPHANQQGTPSLPPLKKKYVKISIKDGPGYVSTIQKFIANRLGCKEDEIDIFLGDDLLPPSLQIQHVVRIWSSIMGPEKRTVRIGSSGEGFLMILSYGSSEKKQ